MIRLAEAVSLAHPDRICDAICESIVDAVIARERRAICALECAVYKDEVYLDGRIASFHKPDIISRAEIEGIVRKHYALLDLPGAREPKLAEELKVRFNLDIDFIPDESETERDVSDDQNIVTGFACADAVTNFLPLEHFTAVELASAFDRAVIFDRGLQGLGPDFKILVAIEPSIGIKQIVLTIQHAAGMSFNEIYGPCRTLILDTLKKLFAGTKYEYLTDVPSSVFTINPFGDFTYGGPLGDNGLSGKKLAVDFYGPAIPIGGGAISGKDPYKIDVCGAFKARELALELVRERGYDRAYTRLAFAPGFERPLCAEAICFKSGKIETVTESDLPDDRLSIVQINEDMDELLTHKFDRLTRGYMNFR